MNGFGAVLTLHRCLILLSLRDLNLPVLDTKDVFIVGSSLSLDVINFLQLSAAGFCLKLWFIVKLSRDPMSFL